MISIFLSQQLALDDRYNLIYYVCDGQDERRNSSISILRGLLWQLTEQRPELTHHLISFFDSPSQCEATLLSEETLWQLLLGVVSRSSDLRLRVLIDGLDECDSDSIQWLALKFADLRSQQNCQTLSMVVLSRYIRDLEGISCLVLDPDHDRQVSTDVEKFIRERIQSVSRKLVFSGELHEKVVQSLLDKSEGTFLWVSFVVDKLAKETKRTRCEEVIRKLPKGLPAFYARMLKNIGPEDRANSKILLTWIAIAFRKISPKTLAAALGCHSNQDISCEEAVSDEIRICAPIIRASDQGIDYVHQSAKDYILRTDEDLDPDLEYFRIKTEDAHLLLAEQCLVALMQGSYLQYYALLNWARHAKKLSTLATQLIQKADFFFSKGSHVRETWWRKFSINFRGLPESAPPPLHVACYIEFEPWVRMLLSEPSNLDTNPGLCIDRQCSSGWSALEYAVEGNNETVVELLLDHRRASGALEPPREQPLKRAAHGGHVKIVGILVAQGMDPRQTMGEACRSEDIGAIQTLASSGVDLNLRVDKKSFLEIAVKQKRMRSLACLLKNGANPDMITEMNEPLLHISTRTGAIKTLELLLDHGANINSVDSLGRTALHHAAETGDADIVQLLMERGANGRIRDSEGELALHKSARQLTRFLLPGWKQRHMLTTGRLFFDTTPEARGADRSNVDMMTATLMRHFIGLGRRCAWYDTDEVRTTCEQIVCQELHMGSGSSPSSPESIGVVTAYSTIRSDLTPSYNEGTKLLHGVGHQRIPIGCGMLPLHHRHSSRLSDNTHRVAYI